jgi:hypothetical protein
MGGALKKRVRWFTGPFVVLGVLALVWLNLGLPFDLATLARLPWSTRAWSGLVILLGPFAAATDSLLSSEGKARIVYLRWRSPMPGSRAFAHRNLESDQRINRARLLAALGSKFPRSPSEQNAAWYGFYERVRKDVRVELTHYEYLLFRDLTWLSLLFLTVAVLSLAFNPHARGALPILVGVPGASLLLFRTAAANRGRRFVNTVLAIASAAEAVPEKE